MADEKKSRYHYDVEKVAACLSEERLGSYSFLLPIEHKAHAVIPYDWMQYLSSMLFIPLQYLEITLRNRIHNVLTSFYEKKGQTISLPGKPKNWIRWMPTNRSVRTDVELAHKNAMHDVKNRVATAGDIISRLQFGVWIRILEEHPGKESPYAFWDRTSSLIFPNAPDKSRKTILKELRDINTIRNRLFHYEPIWKFENMPYQQATPEIGRKYGKIMEVLNWLSTDMHNFIEASGHGKRLVATAIEIAEYLRTVEKHAEKEYFEFLKEWTKKRPYTQEKRGGDPE